MAEDGVGALDREQLERLVSYFNEELIPFPIYKILRTDLPRPAS